MVGDDSPWTRANVFLSRLGMTLLQLCPGPPASIFQRTGAAVEWAQHVGAIDTDGHKRE